jgi:hypothetical protein
MTHYLFAGSDFFFFVFCMTLFQNHSSLRVQQQWLMIKRKRTSQNAEMEGKVGNNGFCGPYWKKHKPKPESGPGPGKGGSVQQQQQQ